MKFSYRLFALFCSLVLASPGYADEKTETKHFSAKTKKSLPGYWEGKLRAGALDLRMGLQLNKERDGSLTAKMISIDQGNQKIKADEIVINGQKVTIRWILLKASYEGTLNEKGDTLTGKWQQSRLTFDLTFRKQDKPTVLSRPQEPKTPYLYTTQKAVIQNEKAKIKLVGELTLPQGKGPHPVAILLSGSGPQNKDGEALTHKPLLVLADHLTRQGIATLRWADRGIAGSQGTYFQSTTEDLAWDVMAAIRYLKSQDTINTKQIGIIGHSEGGNIAPLVASQSKEVAFVVMLAGTGLPGEEVLYLQGAALVKASGGNKKSLQRQRETQEMIFRIARQSKTFDDAKMKFEEEFEKFVSKLPKAEQKAVEKQKESVLGQVGRVMTPWFRSFLDYDPRPALKKVKCPVLVLNGSLDLQVTAKDNLPAITKALGADRKDVTIKELPKLNHMFQTAKKGTVAEYVQIEETISPVVLKLVSNWILQRVSTAKK